MHPSQSPPLTSRISTVFWYQYNVILFAGALLFSAALRSRTPAALGGVGEILWLGLGAGVPDLYRWIEQQRARMRDLPSAQHALAPHNVPDVYAERFAALLRIADDIRHARLDMTGVSTAELRTTLARLETVKVSFLRLAGIHNRGSRFFASSPTADIERDQARLRDALSGEKDLTVRMALRQSLTLVQRRMEHRTQLTNTLRAVELKMEAIEQSFAYLASQVAGLESALELKAEVDAFVTHFSSVDALEALEKEAGAALAHAGAS